MTALSIAIANRGPTRAKREQVRRIELRLDEKAKVYGIADEYQKADRQGDLRIEAAFVRLYQATGNERLRELIVAAYTAWMEDERAEEKAVNKGIGSAIEQMEHNDPQWVGEEAA